MSAIKPGENIFGPLRKKMANKAEGRERPAQDSTAPLKGFESHSD